METIPANDFVPLRTADGSFTLRSEALGEQYHSIHGAVQESMHVFIRAGLHHVMKKAIDLLEVGLGTGLNVLLTWIGSEQLGIKVNYQALEPHPLSSDLLRAIDHPGHIGAPERTNGYLRMMFAEEREVIHLGEHFRCSVRGHDVQQLDDANAFDLIYFDAFAPEKQPEMWTEDVFTRLFSALRPGGVLVTYCAKGEVRRTMLRVGFAVERLRGPKEKLEMLRATKPA